MGTTLLYRRRFIPEECIALKDDTILYQDDNLIVTRWNTLNPRTDFSSGISAYFLSEGLKISKILDSSGELYHWYCDMIHPVVEPGHIIFEDLLIDVIIDKDGTVRVVDTKEAADALREKLISAEMLCEALTSLDYLLSRIYAGNFSEFTNILEEKSRN